MIDIEPATVGIIRQDFEDQNISSVDPIWIYAAVQKGEAMLDVGARMMRRRLVLNEPGLSKDPYSPEPHKPYAERHIGLSCAAWSARNVAQGRKQRCKLLGYLNLAGTGARCNVPVR